MMDSMVLKLYLFANFVLVLIPAVAAAFFADAVVAESAMIVPMSVVTVVTTLKNVWHTLTFTSNHDNLTVWRHHGLRIHDRLLVHDGHLRLGVHHLWLIDWHRLNVGLLLVVNLLLLLWVLTGWIHSRLTRWILTRRKLALRVLTRLHGILLARVARLHFIRY